MDNDDASTVPDSDGADPCEGPAPSWCAAQDAALAATVARWCSDAAAVAAYRSVHFRRTQDWHAIEALLPSANSRRSACAAKNRFWLLLQKGCAPPPNYLTVNSWRDSSGDGAGGAGAGGVTSTPLLAGASKRARASAASEGSGAGAGAGTDAAAPSAAAASAAAASAAAASAAAASAAAASAAAAAASVAAAAAGPKRARGEAGGAEAPAAEGGGGPSAAWGAEEARKLRELVQRFPPAGNPHPKSCVEGSATAQGNAAYWERVAVLLGTERSASSVYKHFLSSRR